MKAQSTIEKKEREYRRDIVGIEKQWAQGNFNESETIRHHHLVDYWRALRWVLGKDDDEMCLTQGEKTNKKEDA